MTKRIRTTVIAALCAVLLACVGLGAWLLRSSAAEAEAVPAQNVGYSTVAVHDPSIVVAYEGADGKTYPTAEAAQAAGGGGSVSKGLLRLRDADRAGEVVRPYQLDGV